MDISFILGIDIGTGSTKAVAVDQNGKALHTEQQFYTTSHPETGYAEQDPDTILNAFIVVISDMIRFMKRVPSAISLSAAMHGIMVVDREGKNLSPLIIWSDARSTHIAEELRISVEGPSIYSRTGTPIHSMTPLCKIKWMVQHQPHLISHGHRFISIKEYIWFHLFKEFVIDHSIASATGLFDLEDLCWNDSALRYAGIREDQLSAPVSTFYIKTGLKEEMANLFGVPQQVPFCIGASDGCLASLGTHSLEPGIAAITIGTSGAVRISGPRPVWNTSMMNFNYLLEENIFISGGPTNNGGNVMQWLKNNFLETDNNPESYDHLFASMISIPPGSEGLIFLPYLFGERAPVWDEQSCGVFFGVRARHRKEHFTRAVLEGICFSLRQVLSKVEASSTPVHRIHASGGFVQSAFWIQLLSDITGKRVAVFQSEDASAIGAAMLAMKAMGLISEYSSMTYDVTTEYNPREEESKLYNMNFRIFEQLYPQLKDLMHGKTS